MCVHDCMIIIILVLNVPCVYFHFWLGYRAYAVTLCQVTPTAITLISFLVVTGILQGSFPSTIFFIVASLIQLLRIIIEVCVHYKVLLAFNSWLKYLLDYNLMATG